MTDSDISRKAPHILSLTPGDYWWCACGKSQNPPFCDGSHEGTEFSPVKFTVESRAPIALCGCKRSGDKPYCDGTHSSL